MENKSAPPTQKRTRTRERNRDTHSVCWGRKENTTEEIEQIKQCRRTDSCRQKK
jgi:hypothetical protein